MKLKNCRPPRFLAFCAVLTAFTVTALTSVAEPSASQSGGTYMLIDLSAGAETGKYPVSFLAEPPAEGWGDEHRSRFLVLRQVPAGSYLMGRHTHAKGRPHSEHGERVAGEHHGWSHCEAPHEVFLDSPFYIGVFEVTRRQWELVMGQDPMGSLAMWSSSVLAPVANVSYQDIRGENKGSEWPQSDAVDSDSFLGVLRAKTGRTFDLPTEAQWEYACRAGKNTDFNNGASYGEEDGAPATEGVAAAPFDSVHGETLKVGCLRPNAWGLYDMHGNVLEWCLDWWRPYLGHSACSNPTGSERLWAAREPELRYDAFLTRVLRGGSFCEPEEGLRSSARFHEAPDIRTCAGRPIYGFRIVCH